MVNAIIHGPSEKRCYPWTESSEIPPKRAPDLFSILCRPPQVQESIRQLLEECAAHRRKRPEQAMAAASVMYGDAMNVSRYRSRMSVVFQAQRLANAAHRI